MKDQIFQFLDTLADWVKLRWTHVCVPLVLALITGILVQNPFLRETPSFRAGEIAPYDIKALGKILVVDEDLTKKKQRAAEDAVKDVYDFDSQLEQVVAARITRAFDYARSRKGTLSASNRKEFETLLGTEVSDNEWVTLVNYHFNRRMQKALELFVAQAYSYWISDQPIDISNDKVNVVVRDLFTEEEKTTSIQDFKHQVIDVQTARQMLDKNQLIKRQARRLVSRRVSEEMIGLAKKLIGANISFNQIETSARKEEARSGVGPVVVQIAKGEMLIREGEKVERKHLLLLKGLRNLEKSLTDMRSYIGFVTLLFILIFIFYRVGINNFKKFRLSPKDQLVLGSFFIASIALLTGFNSLFDAAQVQSLSGVSIRALLPFAFAGMTLRLFTSIEITFFFNVLLSTCVAWLLKDPYLGLTCLTASLAGAASMRHISQRLDVLKAGFFAGVVQSFCICLGVVMGLTESAGIVSPWLNLSTTAGLGVASGVLSAGIVLFSQPIIEFLGYTTDLRLMELSNTNHPLLRQLIMNAPGTYFHSFAVSQLSEKAAEAINANPLFARVASLYHDIGKLKKPQYFIENIKGENKHNSLVPTMSALIISNHVKEGIDLGQQYKLPQSIIDCIPQHHGTALISYFHDKAKKLSEGTGEEVDNRDFRYPGPKPQTKEAAIIMLADSVEATAKSLTNATLDQLRQQVNQTIRRFFLDGQLDECELSLKDLNAIGNAFVNVLQGIYHQRIDYPHLRQKTNSKKKAKTSEEEEAESVKVISAQPKNKKV